MHRLIACRNAKKLEFLRRIDEPIVTGFNPSILAEDLANL